tara:strand:+ start:1137 stop:1658 length:522 start_codon:yes stop_codon:yes gene_type:complete
MSYFDMFPKVFYDNKGNGNYSVMTNLLRRVKLVDDAKLNIVDFDYYDVKDGETPEMIAHKYYGDVNLHWTILTVNEIVDYYEDWPMSVQRFEEFVKEKYENPQAIHHYEITQTSGDTTVTIDVGMNTTEYPSATAISNYQYEDSLQEKKRQIRLIQPRYVNEFVKEFESKLNG